MHLHLSKYKLAIGLASVMAGPALLTSPAAVTFAHAKSDILDEVVVSDVQLWQGDPSNPLKSSKIEREKCGYKWEKFRKTDFVKIKFQIPKSVELSKGDRIDLLLAQREQDNAVPQFHLSFIPVDLIRFSNEKLQLKFGLKKRIRAKLQPQLLVTMARSYQLRLTS